MTAPQTSPLPPAPLSSDPGSVFDEKAFTFLESLEPHRQELQAQADWIDDAVGEVANSAASAAQSAASAAQSAAAADDAAQAAEAAVPAVLDGLRRSVEAASGGKMTVFYTANGQPSYFVRVPKFLCEDIAPGGELGTGVHEAFIFDGQEDAEIWIGAYQASIVNGEAVSQPGVAPKTYIDYTQARAACQATGVGFDMMTIWDWAAISLWCMANGFEPRGNTDNGRHHVNRWEVGTVDGGSGRILTGTGPAQWRHDQTMSGISDLVGNVWEWLSGMKMVDGRVYLSSDNGIPDESAYVDTGFDMPSDREFTAIDSTGAADSVKRALVVPRGVDDPSGRVYTDLSGERMPYRGGYRALGPSCGLGALNLLRNGASSTGDLGFRLRYRVT